MVILFKMWHLNCTKNGVNLFTEVVYLTKNNQHMKKEWCSRLVLQNNELFDLILQEESCIL